MERLSYHEAHEAGVYLSALADIIQSYREENQSWLTRDEDLRLQRAQLDLLSQSNKLLIHSAVYIIEDAERSLETLRRITREIKESYRKIENVQRVIDIFSAIAAFGAAVLIQNPESMLGSLEKVRTTWKDMKPKDETPSS